MAPPICNNKNYGTGRHLCMQLLPVRQYRNTNGCSGKTPATSRCGFSKSGEVSTPSSSYVAATSPPPPAMARLLPSPPEMLRLPPPPSSNISDISRSSSDIADTSPPSSDVTVECGSCYCGFTNNAAVY